jgi:hypothetical protein
MPIARTGSLVTPNGRLQKRSVPCGLIEASKDLAHLYWGDEGLFAYQAFEHINERFYDGQLPWVLIQWAPTEWGACLGYTRVSQEPVITLHPSIMRGSSRVSEGDQHRNPWGVEDGVLGAVYAYEVILHESMHVWIEYVLGGSTGESSHNCPEWIAEVNRIMPLIGIRGVKAGMSKPKRMAVAGELTKRGKQPTKVMRVSDGDLPLGAVSGFPHGVRRHLGLTDYYHRRELPFTPELPDETLERWRVTCNCALHNAPELEAADD